MAKTLTDTILSADQNDLLSIDKTIADMEREIETYLALKKRTVDALKAMRRALDIRLNGRKPRAKPQKAAAEPTRNGDKSMGDRIFDLLTAEGSMPLPAIAARMKVTESTVYYHLKKHDDWFTRKNGEVGIARA